MAPAQLPKAVEAALKGHRRVATGLELAQRKVRKKLEEEPGVNQNFILRRLHGDNIRAQVPGRRQQIHYVKDKCGECPGCLVQATCGSCESCLALLAASTRSRLQEGEREACLEPSRRCSRWIPDERPASVASGSSGGSVTTPASLKLSLDAITKELKNLSDATADLIFAIEASGEGPWEGWPMLTAAELTKKLEDQQDTVEDLQERGETRRLELIQLEELEDGVAEAPLNRAFSAGRQRRGSPEKSLRPGAPGAGRLPAQGSHSREQGRVFHQEDRTPVSPVPNRMGALTFRSSFASELARRLGEVGAQQEQEAAGGREEGLTTGLTPRQSEHGGSNMPPPLAPPNSRRIGRSLSERRSAATGETGGSGRRTGSLQAGDRVLTTGTAASGGRRTQLHQTLERRRRGFTAELADLRGDAEELGEGPIPKAKLDIMEREGDRLRDSIQQIGEDYQNCMDEANERKEVEDLELESADFDEWARKELRELRKEIRSHIQDHPSAAGGFSHIERVKLPSFGGEAQEFHEFRRTFTELTRGANYPPAVMMAQLRARLSGEPLKLVEGHTEVAGAWKELERRYGSKDLAVVTSRQKLLNLTLKGPSYEQVETLLQAVRTARTTLKSHKAEKLLFGDYATVGLLVAKLPAAAQDRWDFHTASLAPEDTPQGRGEQFCSWLEREGAAAAPGSETWPASSSVGSRQGARRPQTQNAISVESLATKAGSVTQEQRLHSPPYKAALWQQQEDWLKKRSQSRAGPAKTQATFQKKSGPSS